MESFFACTETFLQDDYFVNRSIDLETFSLGKAAIPFDWFDQDKSVCFDSPSLFANKNSTKLMLTETTNETQILVLTSLNETYFEAARTQCVFENRFNFNDGSEEFLKKYPGLLIVNSQ
jgi:hypothetical protein